MGTHSQADSTASQSINNSSQVAVLPNYDWMQALQVLKPGLAVLPPGHQFHFQGSGGQFPSNRQVLQAGSTVSQANGTIC